MAGTLVLFDFDGTITRADTLFSFTKHAVPTSKYLVGLFVLSPILLLHKLGFISAPRTKEIFLSWYFNGLPLSEFNSHGEKFSTIIDQITRPKAATQINDHKRAGHRIVVVSASAENWIKPWASKHGLELLATKLQVVGGRITGKIDGENCNLEEKVSRIKAHLNLSDYDEIIVYGDSKGDRPMMTLGTRTIYKPFRD
jgi:phosphatidylglycerophosphatase C